MAKFSKAQYEILTEAFQAAFDRIQSEVGEIKSDAYFSETARYNAELAFNLVVDEVAKVLVSDNRKFNPVEFRLNVRK